MLDDQYLSSFIYNYTLSFPLRKEGSCSAFAMEIIFHSHANKTFFHKKGRAPSLILKVRVFGTLKWPIRYSLKYFGNVFQTFVINFLFLFAAK